MKAEIYVHGPITCAIKVDKVDEFYKYKGGIFKKYIKKLVEDDLDHAVSVVGWGTDEHSGEEFWIVRNSWGTYWGEYGFFKLPIGTNNNLGIEIYCNSAIPRRE
jgi:cathepsin X